MKKFLVACLLALCCYANVQSEPFVAQTTQHVEGGLPLSQESICLAWILDNEARTEPIKGIRAVLDVIYTRMKKRGLSACKVIAEPGQFSGYNRHKKLRVTIDMLTKLEEVDNMEPVVPDAEYFHAIYVHPGWHGMKKIAKIGKHVFYKQA